MEDQGKEFSKIIKSNIWIYESRIPFEICDYIINEFKDRESEPAAVGSNNSVNKEIRNVKTCNVPRSHWINGIPMYFGFDSNFDNFRFSISDIAFTEFFTYEMGCFYKPHTDVNPDISHPAHNRKLTIIIQLSDENDYSGGELQIYSSELKPITMTKKKGSIIVFNSSIPHRVKKVKSGIRHVLASWVIGPAFS